MVDEDRYTVRLVPKKVGEVTIYTPASSHESEHVRELSNLSDNLSKPDLSSDALNEISRRRVSLKQHLNEDHDCNYEV